ncbi:hypothetical protein JOL79_02155 [Microbispora sp. RL4-1S]|uniref:Uncharacterized protein n=1 Tax=Microbispora oryzae TaxID=2806554 RepID=A0A940WBU4_9ACTN|nr:hypothetical protein [Microbispora oryzae]MBP2702604.1 hypothetical protein [Microbispora oryzae]
MAAPRQLFDIRRVIGGLFLVYGLILTATGLLDGSAALRKAEGIRINLWTGIGMLVIGGAFLLWERLRPSETPSDDSPVADEGDAAHPAP